MDGLTLIREANNVGLRVAADGDKLVIRGPRQAEPIARKLIENKRIVLAALRYPADPADWREHYEERAAFRQYEAGYRRDMAEQLAWGECIERWCELNPMLHMPGVCAGCRAPLGAELLELCDGASVHWERHLGFTCLIEYGFQRKRRAVAAFVGMGLMPPRGWEP